MTYTTFAIIHHTVNFILGRVVDRVHRGPGGRARGCVPFDNNENTIK